MHVTDWFTTFLHAAGTEEPSDRQVDGLNQLPWLRGEEESSRRDGYIYWMGQEMYGVKWRNFKLVLVSQKYSTDAVQKLSSPRIVNLTVDPKEREPLNLPYMHSWTVSHFNRLISEFRGSVALEPLVPMGSPLQFVPGRT
jgi:arylsulfatase A-like enzyme